MSFPRQQSPTSAINSLTELHRWSPCTWGSKLSQNSALSNTWVPARHEFEGDAVCIQLGDCDNQGLAVPPPLFNPRAPVPSSTAATALQGGVGLGIILACSVLWRDGPPGPLIYGHWCNSFNVIYLTIVEMANAWRRAIGHAGFVHF